MWIYDDHLKGIKSTLYVMLLVCKKREYSMEFCLRARMCVCVYVFVCARVCVACLLDVHSVLNSYWLWQIKHNL